ncbi:hypothetical protein [Synechococcus sp. CBW1107]|uniref:hypothetical protein n=1 Tax=Synechococcus sp. CBW1107 TaxID=2789857 RepID=UPI002AD5A8DD|nr:hypothetical protein [Synechococcus sp. CBW1107]CAK6692239.1 hypothetical protein IFHNHDMJ_01178 [Synechococcus sp. CBW1107]
MPCTEEAIGKEGEAERLGGVRLEEPPPVAAEAAARPEPEARPVEARLAAGRVAAERLTARVVEVRAMAVREEGTRAAAVERALLRFAGVVGAAVSELAAGVSVVEGVGRALGEVEPLDSVEAMGAVALTTASAGAGAGASAAGVTAGAVSADGAGVDPAAGLGVGVAMVREGVAGAGERNGR